MKTIKYAVAAVALSALFRRFRRRASLSTQAQDLNKIGVVSAEGATTLDGLEAKLAEKQPLPAQVDTPSRPLTVITN